jgi:hypothetical protein
VVLVPEDLIPSHNLHDPGNYLSLLKVRPDAMHVYLQPTNRSTMLACDASAAPMYLGRYMHVQAWRQCRGAMDSWVLLLENKDPGMNESGCLDGC